MYTNVVRGGGGGGPHHVSSGAFKEPPFGEHRYMHKVQENTGTCTRYKEERSVKRDQCMPLRRADLYTRWVEMLLLLYDGRDLSILAGFHQPACPTTLSHAHALRGACFQ